MEYGLLIGVIIFLAVAGFYGYARGMVKIMLSMIAMIVTIILTTILAVPVGKIVKEVTPIYDNMYETVEESVKEYNIIDVSSVNKLDLPKQIKEKITDTEEIIDNYEKYVATEITDTAFNAGVYLVLLVVIYIIVKLVITMLDFVAKLPLIKEVNKMGGFAIGIIYGFVVIWIACLILTACSSKPWAKDIFAAINDNSILGFIYNNNLITWLVTKFL